MKTRYESIGRRDIRWGFGTIYISLDGVILGLYSFIKKKLSLTETIRIQKFWRTNHESAGTRPGSGLAQNLAGIELRLTQNTFSKILIFLKTEHFHQGSN